MVAVKVARPFLYFSNCWQVGPPVAHLSLPPCRGGRALPPVRWLFDLYCARVLRAGRIKRTSQTGQHPHGPHDCWPPDLHPANANKQPEEQGAVVHRVCSDRSGCPFLSTPRPQSPFHRTTPHHRPPPRAAASNIAGGADLSRPPARASLYPPRRLVARGGSITSSYPPPPQGGKLSQWPTKHRKH